MNSRKLSYKSQQTVNFSNELPFGFRGIDENKQPIMHKLDGKSTFGIKRAAL